MLSEAVPEFIAAAPRARRKEHPTMRRGPLLLCGVLAAATVTAACSGDGAKQTTIGQTTATTIVPTTSAGITTTAVSTPATSAVPVSVVCKVNGITFVLPDGWTTNIETDTKTPSCLGLMPSVAARRPTAPAAIKVSEYFGQVDGNPFPIAIEQFPGRASLQNLVDSALQFSRSTAKAQIDSSDIVISGAATDFSIKKVGSLSADSFVWRVDFVDYQDRSGAAKVARHQIYVSLPADAGVAVVTTLDAAATLDEKAVVAMFDSLAAVVRLA